MTPQIYMQNREEYIRQSFLGVPRFNIGPDFPILNEDAEQSFDYQYIFHTAWAARVLQRNQPEKHVDVGSCLYLVAIVSAFIPIEHYDFRPPDLNLDGLTVRSADIMALPFPDGSVKSLSCLHTVEHIGLGRYGDLIDANGDLKAMGELRRVVAPEGHLLFVVPLGDPPTVYLNAHRTYQPDQIMEAFAPMQCLDFQNLHGAGCFHFRKVTL
jgi:SAM-dependent methyltransferase